MRRIAPLVFSLLAACSSCGDDGSKTEGEDGPPPDGSGADAVREGWFRHGMNAGYYGPGIDDAEAATLATNAGADSSRVSLPEHHLAMWGATIEKSDFATYAARGMDHLVVFLTGPTAAHSNAPSGSSNEVRDHYSPRNLYEPIFLPDGSVNPENYWAAYVETVASNYGDQIDVYEVWNEPDQVGGNWQATLDWDVEPPDPDDLIWWNDTIFAYIRMLRVTHAVVRKLDPTAGVATGGIGYPSYLSALLRYTDEPDHGAIDEAHPATGGAYVDVISYHYYPVFAPGNSDVGARGLIAARDEYQAVLEAAAAPSRPFVVTESGAPRRAFGMAPGGVEYARNYLIKLMVHGRAGGLLGVDWFALGESRALDAATDSFQVMGLYENYSAATTTDQVVITDTGVAYATLGAHLRGASLNVTATAALPSAAKGAVFEDADGGTVYVLWAETASGEGASATVDLASSTSLVRHAWDHSRTNAETTLASSGGTVSVALTSAPVFLVAQ